MPAKTRTIRKPKATKSERVAKRAALLRAAQANPGVREVMALQLLSQPKGMNVFHIEHEAVEVIFGSTTTTL